MKFRSFTPILFAILSLGLFVSTAAAVPIIDFVPLGGVTDNIGYTTGGVFETADSGSPQEIGFNFLGDLENLPDILANASISISDIHAVGDVIKNGDFITQNTTGGFVNLWSENETELLLSAHLGAGTITGTEGSITGVSYQTWALNIVGGSLAPAFADQTMVDFNVTLETVAAKCVPLSKRCFLASTIGFYINDGITTSNGTLDSFRGSITGGSIIGKGGTPPPEVIPEPATSFLLLSGLIAGAGIKRRKS